MDRTFGMAGERGPAGASTHRPPPPGKGEQQEAGERAHDEQVEVERPFAGDGKWWLLPGTRVKEEKLSTVVTAWSASHSPGAGRGVLKGLLGAPPPLLISRPRLTTTRY
jgi:hypothetical protein